MTKFEGSFFCMNTDAFFMKRCITLAQKGMGYTYPNPLVGCVIVHRGKIIAEGWHKKSGHDHAEREAIGKIKDPELLQNSTLYVNLEPCDHFGKTPPCTDLILKMKIPRVVIGCMDENQMVHGRGIKKLQAAGCQVQYGVMEKDCKRLNRRFFTYHQKKRPFILLKWAESKDGFLAPKKNSKPYWLTSPLSKQMVHRWRSQEQAIMVGVQTAVDDRPKLNARLWFGNHPTPVIIDPNHRCPQSLLSNWKKQNRHFIIIDQKKETVEERMSAAEIAKQLFDQGIQSVLIEGGTKTLQTFIDQNLWDEARIFSTQSILSDGIPAPDFDKSTFHSLQSIEDDQLMTFYND